MKEMKKLVISMMVGTMIISSATMSFADAKKDDEIFIKLDGSTVESFHVTGGTDIDYNGTIDIAYNETMDDFEMNYEQIDFKTYMGDMLSKVSSTDKSQMEKHYNAAEKFEKAGKYDEADKQWDAFDKLMEKYDDEFRKLYASEIPTYAEFMKDSKDFMKTVDTKSDKEMKTLYEAALKLEKNGKFEEADKKWDEFYDKFETFADFPEEDKDFMKTIDAKSDKEMKAIYDAALTHEKNGKFKEADKKWAEFDKLFETFIDEVELENCSTDGSL